MTPSLPGFNQVIQSKSILETSLRFQRNFKCGFEEEGQRESWKKEISYHVCFIRILNPSGQVEGTGRCKLLLPTPQIMAEESTSL